jgi:hypothetical protein
MKDKNLLVCIRLKERLNVFKYSVSVVESPSWFTLSYTLFQCMSCRHTSIYEIALSTVQMLAQYNCVQLTTFCCIVVAMKLDVLCLYMPQEDWTSTDRLDPL